MRRWPSISFGALVVLGAVSCPAPAWFGNSIPTMREQLSAADAVIVGTLRRATPPNPSGSSEGVTDFAIDKVIQGQTWVGGRKTITLRQTIRAAGRGPAQYIVFGYAIKGKLSYHAGFSIEAGSAVPGYLDAIRKWKGAKASKRLRFYFDHLEHAEEAIAADAFEEFARCEYLDYRNYRGAAETVSGDKVAAWVRDAKTPEHRRRFYASLLGHCSKDRERDAVLLHSLLKQSKAGADLTSVLTGYVLLQPCQGWEYVRGILGDPARANSVRLAACRTVRFLRDWRPELIARAQLIDGVALLLDDAELDSTAIYELWELKAWGMTERILALQERKAHAVPSTRRAILSFALRSPRSAAKRFVEEQRRSDPTEVAEAEEILKLERVPGARPQ